MAHVAAGVAMYATTALPAWRAVSASRRSVGGELTSMPRRDITVSWLESFYSIISPPLRLEQGTNRVDVPQIPPLREMRTQARLRAPRRHPTQRPQRARPAEHDHPGGLRQRGGQAVEDHGAVVEHVRREAVALAFGLEGGAEAVGEEDGGDAAEGVLQDREEEGGGGVAGCVADADP